ncbi:F-box/FBD/LRR-repeat protein At3g52680-like [Lycium barbarum]|uniref:F-box/FBD/LRR-repeat protein At3g52680-like n=1 Tax=Lycium barbarum TaxID=112863 RepID=UPI00293F1446|nr:F-box/FBD/LRR-repeat protein At3g52680-like [Lycium barbarum]
MVVVVMVGNHHGCDGRGDFNYEDGVVSVVVTGDSDWWYWCLATVAVVVTDDCDCAMVASVNCGESTDAERLRKNRGRANNYIAQNYMNYYYEGRGIDRISELPRHLIDDILNHMSIKEIARMSVLSRKWNRIWSTHPTIVLDHRFHEEINYRNRSSSSDIFYFKNIVNNIILQHSGPIVKFVLDISSIGSDDGDINSWLRYVSNRGVKELRIENSVQSTYTLPYFLFNSRELSHLDITNCAFKMPLAVTSFKNLVRLDLNQISFNPTLAYTIFEAPLLLTMLFTNCNGLQYLNIFASRLLGLHIVDSHHVDLNILKAYTELKVLTIASCDKIQHYEFWRRFTLKEIICSFPKLTGFCFNSTFFKQKLSNHVEQIEMDAVTEYLTRPDCIEEDLIALRKIKLEGFVNTTNERLFMKLMLARCPSLVKVIVTPFELIEEDHIFYFFLAVLRFPRASLNVTIEYQE